METSKIDKKCEIISFKNNEISFGFKYDKSCFVLHVKFSDVTFKENLSRDDLTTDKSLNINFKNNTQCNISLYFSSEECQDLKIKTNGKEIRYNFFFLDHNDIRLSIFNDECKVKLDENGHGKTIDLSKFAVIYDCSSTIDLNNMNATLTKHIKLWIKLLICFILFVIFCVCILVLY